MSKRNIRLLIAFDGTNYQGWQRQKIAPTIQGTIENRLEIMTRAPVTLHGAGRTDAGVHAAGMTANFHTETDIPNKAFVAGLNSMLPVDIRILEAVEEKNSFHSRYDATGKTYCYTFFTGRIQDPTRRLYCAHLPCAFNASLVPPALKHLIGTHDFSSFEGKGSRDQSGKNGRGGVRTLHALTLVPHPVLSRTWSFRFVGDGFLRHMVRNIAGTLIKVGTAGIEPDSLPDIIAARDRGRAGPTAPANGLVLEKVWYEPLDT